MLRIVRDALAGAQRRRGRRALRPRARAPAARSRAARSPATPTPAPRSRSRSPTASSPASAGSATTSSSSSRWPPTGPSRSARSATTARWRRSRPSARTSPTTSRRRSPSSPTRRSTASARSSTSRPAPVFGRRPSIDAAGADTGTIETAFPVILGGHHDLAPLSDETYRRIAREHQHLPARGPLGGVPRPRRRRRHLAARVGDDPGRDRADQAGGGEEGPRRRRAAGPHRPHRLRRRAPLPRPAPGDLGGRPGAEAVQGRARRGEPAPPLRHRPALGGDPQRPRRDARPRPRRQRRLPLHDGRGDLRRGLRDRRRQPLRRRCARGSRR